MGAWPAWATPVAQSAADVRSSTWRRRGWTARKWRSASCSSRWGTRRRGPSCCRQSCSRPLPGEDKKNKPSGAQVEIPLNVGYEEARQPSAEAALIVAALRVGLQSVSPQRKVSWISIYFHISLKVERQKCFIWTALSFYRIKELEKRRSLVDKSTQTIETKEADSKEELEKEVKWKTLTVEGRNILSAEG